MPTPFDDIDNFFKLARVSFKDVVYDVAIHGITEKTVLGAPKFPSILPHLREDMEGRVAVCHTHFDRTSIAQACDKYGLPVPAPVWLDSARVARRTWPEFARGGYGLKNVCDHIGYGYNSHDALEDAKACGQVVLEAIRLTGIDLDSGLSE